jgi:hypothetical protein
MENQELVQNEEKTLSLNQESISYLEEIRKWSFFLSIMGFIAVGFMVLASFFIGIIFSFIPDQSAEIPFPTYLFSVIYLVIAAVYFVPVYYLYQFSVKMKYALKQKANDFLENAFKYLKSHYKFIGIATIVMLVLYPIIIAVAVIFGVMSNM